MGVPEFGEMFMASKGAPIKYGDKTLIMSDKVPAHFGERFLVTMESTDSSYPQGVGISEGVEVFGEEVKRAVAWEYFSLPPKERRRQKTRFPFSFLVILRTPETLPFFLHPPQ